MTGDNDKNLNDGVGTPDDLLEPPGNDRRAELVLVDSLPGLARIAAGMWLRGAVWGVGTSIRISARLAHAAASPEAASELVRDWGGGIRTYARELLGVTDLDNRVREIVPPLAASPVRHRNGNSPDRRDVAETLRQQGAELLRMSAEVGIDDEIHPAYARILAELAPDEARILRLLSTHGPQPVVDIHSTNLIGVGSQLVAPGLNMVGTEAGCRHLDRVPAYLNNLLRLSLVEFSDDAIDDHMIYQVIEAQPGSVEAMRRAGRPKTVHRSLRLTPFGADFCGTVLPVTTAEIEAVTGIELPDDRDTDANGPSRASEAAAAARQPLGDPRDPGDPGEPPADATAQT